MSQYEIDNIKSGILDEIKSTRPNLQYYQKAGYDEALSITANEINHIRSFADLEDVRVWLYDYVNECKEAGYYADAPDEKKFYEGEKAGALACFDVVSEWIDELVLMYGEKSAGNLV